MDEIRNRQRDRRRRSSDDGRERGRRREEYLGWITRRGGSEGAIGDRGGPREVPAGPAEPAVRHDPDLDGIALVNRGDGARIAAEGHGQGFVSGPHQIGVRGPRPKVGEHSGNHA